MYYTCVCARACECVSAVLPPRVGRTGEGRGGAGPEGLGGAGRGSELLTPGAARARRAAGCCTVGAHGRATPCTPRSWRCEDSIAGSSMEQVSRRGTWGSGVFLGGEGDHKDTVRVGAPRGRGPRHCGRVGVPGGARALREGRGWCVHTH